jgi:hypothetical protein
MMPGALQYQASERGSLAFGLDNVFNEKNLLFHPFPLSGARQADVLTRLTC